MCSYEFAHWKCAIDFLSMFTITLKKYKKTRTYLRQMHTSILSFGLHTYLVNRWILIAKLVRQIHLIKSFQVRVLKYTISKMTLLLFKLFIVRIVWTPNFSAQFVTCYTYPIKKSRQVVEFFLWVQFLQCSVVSKVIQDNKKEILHSILRRRATDSATEKISLAASWKA